LVLWEGRLQNRETYDPKQSDLEGFHSAWLLAYA